MKLTFTNLAILHSCMLFVEISFVVICNFLFIQIKSKEGEKIPLVKPVNAQGNVEVWLGELMRRSQKSLHAVIREAYMLITQDGFNLLEFINLYPAQVCRLTMLQQLMAVCYNSTIDSP